jgi:putative ABC transport system ATP-binding protein
VRDLVFGWRRDAVTLDLPELEIARGEKVFLKGPSGSGKSTLLGLIAGVLKARTGSVNVLGEDLTRLSGARRDALRADRIGVIFQMFNLLPYLSVLGNVALPCRFSPVRAKRAAGPEGSVESEARRLLARLGLDEDRILRASARELSVGQQQRVAAARALIGGPDLVIADEPTSSLDADARGDFLKLLLEEVEARGASLLFVSHDASLAGRFDRALDLAAINRAENGASVIGTRAA